MRLVLMRFVLAIFFALLSTTAFAQKVPTPVRPKVATVKVEVAQISDFESPDAGKRWRIHRVEIGRLWLLQVQNEKATKVLAYRSMRRRLKISVINPSILKDAHIRLDCGTQTPINPRDVGIKTLAKSETWRRSIPTPNSGRGVADCTLVSDIPVHVAALVEEIISEQPTPGSAGLTSQQSTTAWPAFRLVGPH